MNTKNIIFDLDGTLWDATETVLQAWGHALQGEFQVSPDQLKSCVGKTNDEIYKFLFPSLSKEQRNELMEKCFVAEEKLIAKQGSKLYEGVEETLNELHKNFNLYIVSNCQKNYIEPFLSHYDFGKYFKDFESAGNTGMEKSKNIALIMNRNHLTDAVYVGDTEGDQKASLANDIPFIYASYGFGTCNAFDHRIDSFSEILTLLK